MATLLLISTPAKNLTYDDGDVVECLDAGTSPGTAVEANVGGHWSFVYITDRNHTDAEVQDLKTPLISGGDDEEQTLVHKRISSCTLPGDASTYQTYVAYADAPKEMKMTWAAFSATLSDKTP